MSRQVAVISGEDSAPEAMEASVALLERMRPGIDWVFIELGLDALGLIRRRSEALDRFQQNDRIARPWVYL